MPHFLLLLYWVIVVPCSFRPDERVIKFRIHRKPYLSEYVNLVSGFKFIQFWLIVNFIMRAKGTEIKQCLCSGIQLWITYLQTLLTLTKGGVWVGEELGMRSPIVAVIGDQHALAEVISQDWLEIPVSESRMFD